ncbi:MAG TPA: hypothetical protein VM165_17670, partial [Planctomycetaceae bacterium]|nr:hypothetical protein [Planctomycetaceae bacterium]
MATAIAYPFSIGPAAALAAHGVVSCESIASAYCPVLFVRNRLPDAAKSVIQNYITGCAGHNTALKICVRHCVWEFNSGFWQPSGAPTVCGYMNSLVDDEKPA